MELIYSISNAKFSTSLSKMLVMLVSEVFAAVKLLNDSTFENRTQKIILFYT